MGRLGLYAGGNRNGRYQRSGDQLDDNGAGEL
jgi:hypothetical protein